jgi:hypothetical protein
VNDRAFDMSRRAGAALALALAACGSAALAAEAPAKPQAPPPKTSELLVTAKPLPGAVIGDVKPELEITPEDIQTYGISTVTELLDELAPETQSDRGRGGEGPVILLNGRRISGFNEVRDIPAEAILRVDILPEEAALKYGFAADQRVVNIVLRDRFKAETGELSGGAATEGGLASGQGEAILMRIRGDNRINLDLKAQAASALTEDERDIRPIVSGPPFDLLGNVVSPTAGGEIDPALSALVGRPVTVAGLPAGLTGAPTLQDFVPTAGVANVTDVGRYRTLSPSTSSVQANAVFTRPVLGGVIATVNGTLGASRSQSLLGLPGVGLLVPAGDPFSPFGQDVLVDRYANAMGPLRQSTKGWSGHLGVALHKDFTKWRLSLTGAYDHGYSQTLTDTGVDASQLQALLTSLSPLYNPFTPLPSSLAMRGRDEARSTSDSANVQFLANGPLLKLPAGDMHVSLKGGYAGAWQNSASTRFGLFQAVDLSRGAVSGQGSLDLPVASRMNNVLAFLGDVTLNANASGQRLSDFGTLTSYGYGVNWTPWRGVTFLVSRTLDQAAPSVQQLGNPVVVTSGVRILDFATGDTVDVRRVDGGEPGLASDRRQVLKIGLTLKPIATQNLTITANYVATHLDNAIETFPAATAEIEAAFPERFLRDPSGRLVQVDYRPVNFDAEDRKSLRLGINFSKPLGRQPQRRFNRRPGGGGPFGGGNPPPDGGPDTAAADDSGQGGGGQNGGQGGGPPEGFPQPGGGGGRGGFGGGGRGGFGGGGFGGGRGGRGGGGLPQGGQLQLAVYYTIFLEDTQVVRPGVPLFDRLDGSYLGTTGGRPRHEIEAQAGFLKNGFGVRLSGAWRSSTFVRGGGPPSDDLHFSDFEQVSVRLFANLDQRPKLMKAYPWLKGSRITFSVSNIFDHRVSVHDGNGVTPASYQPGYIDPAGRTFRLAFRKVFS